MLIINLPMRVINKCSYLLATLKRNAKSHEITSLYSTHDGKCRRSHSSTVRGPWSVLFFGTDNFSLESLRSLYNE